VRWYALGVTNYVFLRPPNSLFDVPNRDDQLDQNTPKSDTNERAAIHGMPNYLKDCVYAPAQSLNPSQNSTRIYAD
jgi:hypothetical protein